MPKLKFIIFLVFTVFSLSRAQRFEISVMGGYQFGGATDETTQEGGVFTFGDAMGISGSGNYGVHLDIPLRPKMKLEIYWDRQHTRLNYHDSQTDEWLKIANLNVDYFQIGLIYDWSHTSVRPFIGGTIGFVNMSPDMESVMAETQFAASPIVGVRVFASDYFAFRFQGRFSWSRIPEGRFFTEYYEHHKETFMTQIQLGMGVTLAL
jgi:hypothetical protein